MATASEHYMSPTFKEQTFHHYESPGLPETISFTTDNMGRLHLPTPYSGPSVIKVRAQPFQRSTAQTHIVDLYEIISKIKEESNINTIAIMLDGGPDFNPGSLINTLYFYRLFVSLGLDSLWTFSFAARYSAYNCIEHLWAVMSGELSGVVLPSILPGESETFLNMKEKRRRHMFLIQLSMTSVKFDGFPVETIPVECKESTHMRFGSYDRVKDFLKSPLRDLGEYPDIMAEMKMILKHVDRHANELVFMKCEDRSCCKESKSKTWDLGKILKSLKTELQARV